MSIKSVGKAALSVIKSVAPTLATALGGPFSGVAMKFLADKFTGGDTGRVEDFILAASPDHLLQMREAEYEFETKMRELDIREEELKVQTTAGARQLAEKTSVWPQVTLSVVFTTGYFTILYQFLTGDVAIPTEHKESFMVLVGVLTAAMPTLMHFWFGSSLGSKQKTQSLTDVAKSRVQ